MRAWKYLAGALAGVGMLIGASLASAQTSQCIATMTAQGTSDAITIPSLPCAYTTNLLILTASAANLTTTPTLQPIGLNAEVIVRPDGTALRVGDIPAANYRMLLTPTGFTWILLNPATFSTSAPNSQSGTTYAIQASDCGNVVNLTSGSSTVVSLPNSLTNCNFVIQQLGAGSVSISPSAGASVTSAHCTTRTAQLQFSAMALFETSNTTGSNAIYNLGGDCK